MPIVPDGDLSAWSVATPHAARPDDAAGTEELSTTACDVARHGDVAEQQGHRNVPRLRPPVIADVARLAQVSHQTVSRVINGHDSVRPATRERVSAAIRHLSYRPNAAARSLATRRSRIVGILTSHTSLFGPAATIFAIERAARLEGYGVTISSMEGLGEDLAVEALEVLLMCPVEGVVIVGYHPCFESALVRAPSHVPMVATVGGPGSVLSYATTDEHAAARSATGFLLALGHRTVFHVSGPRTSIDATRRVEGWRAALSDARAPTPPLIEGDWSARSGYTAGCRLAKDPNMTAVFVANDQMAIGVLRALSEHGLCVPEDVSVVGFDDVPEAAYLTPPLTTVRQDFAGVALGALELLSKRRNGAERREERLIPAVLIGRASTGPATRQRQPGAALI